VIKYNLKKILIEEDDIDIVDTTFMDKWDEVPATDYGWEYFDDLKKHIRGRLTDYVKNNPDVTFQYYTPQSQRPKIKYQEGRRDQMVDHYISDWEDHAEYHDNHIENSRADTWIKDFHMWLENM
jgi:hypothetical protein